MGILSSYQTTYTFCVPRPPALFEIKIFKYKENCKYYLTASKVPFSLTFLSGKLKRNSLSKRPGLLRAGSIESSLFVAPMTTISPRLSRPSIKANSVDTIELRTEKWHRNAFRVHDLRLSSIKALLEHTGHVFKDYKIIAKQGSEPMSTHSGMSLTTSNQYRHIIMDGIKCLISVNGIKKVKKRDVVTEQ